MSEWCFEDGTIIEFVDVDAEDFLRQSMVITGTMLQEDWKPVFGSSEEISRE